MLNSLVFLKNQRQSIYIALEDMDFVWDEKDVATVDQMWSEGVSIWDIGKSFGRDPDEVALLIIDRKRKGFIGERPGGAWGGKSDEKQG